VRLIRLARLRSIFSIMLERIKSEQLIVIAGIINIMLVIMSLGHVIACVWYGIAIQDREDTWLQRHGFDTVSLEMKYFTALHWSLLQFAGGTDEIVPQNTGERIYAVLVFIVAFVLAAVFVGRLTSSMTQLHMLSRKDVEKFQTLKRYLLKNQISAMLSFRVMHNAQHALAETQRFMEESRVELLGIISEPLRVEIHFELYAPVLEVHPFFQCFIDACPQVMKKVCHAAVSQLLVSNGDVIFMPGEVPASPRMFIVCIGELSYTYVNGAVHLVQSSQWLSEAALWTSWTHQGMLRAASDCRLCLLDAVKFAELADAFDHGFDLRYYVRTFLRCLNTGEIAVTDLPYNEDATILMQAIQTLASVRASPTPMARVSDQQYPSPRWSRQESNQSLVSDSTTVPEDGQPGSPGSQRRSVLMVTPNANGNGSESKPWW